ncbi:unnamed protein product [Oppiella nova]|uniref:Uncharacterized protein n=1 Tax=Oppiella nova TaxID=334625 RepID=A0A7R9R253_9ACAR|nr:unnamed protein product [Oppiella nova]CAG2182825.1 unnamed protein product [Oppiella nova]
MSYVSNARRVSGRYRQSVRLVAIGVAVGSAVLAVDSIYRRLSLKLKARRQLSSAAKIIAAEDVPQTNASRSVDQMDR